MGGKSKPRWRARIYKKAGDHTGNVSYWTTELFSRKEDAVRAARKSANLLYKLWKDIGVGKPKESYKSDGSIEFILTKLQPHRWPRAEPIEE